MKLDLEEMTGELSQAVRGQVAVRPHGDGVLRVETPFQFNDGDHLVIRLRENGGDRLEWTDLGHTFMHLSYSMDVGTLGEGKRAELLEDALRRLDVEDREGELVLPTSRADLGRTLLAFAQAIVHVSDLEYLTQERVDPPGFEAAVEAMEDAYINTIDRFDARNEFRVALRAALPHLQQGRAGEVAATSGLARAKGLAQAIAECRDDARMDGIREGAAEIVDLIDAAVSKLTEQESLSSSDEQEPSRDG